MKKIILGTLSLSVISAFAGDLSAVTSIGSSSLNSEQQLQNSKGSCDSGCSITTTFPGSGISSGTTLLSQAVIDYENQSITCVAAGHPVSWSGFVTQTRSFTSQNGVKVAGTESAWLTTSDNCVAPMAVVAPITTYQFYQSIDFEYASSGGGAAEEGWKTRGLNNYREFDGTVVSKSAPKPYMGYKAFGIGSFVNSNGYNITCATVNTIEAKLGVRNPKSIKGSGHTLSDAPYSAIYQKPIDPKGRDWHFFKLCTAIK